MVKPVEGWTVNGGVRIHYIDSNPVGSQELTPLIYVSGALNGAEGLLPEMEALAPRRVISMALRGRGKSDAPMSGYSFQENVSDVEAVMDTLGPKNFCLMGWSLGVPHVIRYATRHLDKVNGLIFLDYPARYPKFTKEWTDRTLTDPVFRLLAPERAVRGIQQDSVEILLWDELKDISCPVLIVGGSVPSSKDSPAGSLLKPEHIELYEENLRDVQIAVLEGAGHNVSQPDFKAFIEVLNGFLRGLDDSG
jgi:pimeloyl-ACP methyl ester carboxylesterase